MDESKGDRNTRFYHASTLITRNKKKIVTLCNTSREWVSDPDDLERMVGEYYQALFTNEQGDCGDMETPWGFLKIPKEKNQIVEHASVNGRI